MSRRPNEFEPGEIRKLQEGLWTKWRASNAHHWINKKEGLAHFSTGGTLTINPDSLDCDPLDQEWLLLEEIQLMLETYPELKEFWYIVGRPKKNRL